MATCLCCESNQLIEIGYFDCFSRKSLVQCSSCRHIQVGVPPTEEQLRDFYTGIYSAQRKSYMGKRYMQIMRRRASAHLRYCYASIPKFCNKLLDIGCGYGALVSLATQRGINALGLEYDQLAIEYGARHHIAIRKINSEQDIVKEIAAFGPALIVMSHALEHFRDPEQILQACHESLIFIEVPAYSPELYEQFSEQEGHLNFFHKGGLLTLLSRLGFSVENHGCYGPALKFFWCQSWTLPRKVLQLLARDYFLYQYGTLRDDGIWVRALARGRLCRS